ncbi:putative bifunctional diguanylate cyclase/phosphodiesterase [Occallatibacter riparius]|uniref:Bifunctional diguanylate cyclase/phosphodiesterase n=1 Tax=Occallatibacter riparius TaxID=1002689 RepID=A0A9J7BW46_9BACT|nr:bifunctional diguanylate cyclase/phosphodiesterase [Occallatibacter riparius]UWZ85229.1 bifunctional diguanylate cyclase/phosphodiesterase [Occallatibacter riparius]
MNSNVSRLSVDTLLLAGTLVIVAVIARLWRNLSPLFASRAREIDRLATHDDLTGLPNRRHLERTLARVLDGARRSGMELALLHFDIDHFKLINDIFGTDLADKVLQLTADRIKAASNRGLFVARVGDDEFMALIHGMNQADALNFARHIVSQLERPAVFDRRHVPLSVSAGVAVCFDEYPDPESFRRQAARALRVAKHGGGRTATVCDNNLILMHQRRTRIAETLTDALNSGEGLSLAYQPVFRTDRRLHGLEALVRIKGGEQEGLPTSEVISVAEERGLILPLGRWVIKTVCAQMRVWKTEYNCVPLVAVNVSPIEFMQPGFATQVVDTIRSAGVDPNRVVLELTESTIMSNLLDTRDQIAELHGSGITIAVDDFGTGYSGLSYLHELDLDALKIDRSFVDRMCISQRSALVVRAIIEMAQALDIRCIAEGVETEDQFSLLRNMGCGLFQGYLFGRPVAANEIAPLLQPDN